MASSMGEFEHEMFSYFSEFMTTKTRTDSNSYSLRHIELSKEEFDDCIKFFVEISLLLQDPEHRCRVTKADITFVATLTRQHLSSLSQLATNKTSNEYIATLDIVVQLLRLLRNACAGCSSSQQAVLQCVDLIESLSVMVCGLLENNDYTSTDTDCHLSEKELCMLRTAVQFTGNAVSGCSENAQLFWSVFFPSFRLLLRNRDTSLKSYTCMFIYNCLNSNHLSQLIETESGVEIISLVIGHVVDKDCEWSLYIVERLLVHKGALRASWSALNETCRSFLVEVMCTRLHDTVDSAQCAVDIDSLEFITELISHQEETHMSERICQMLECLCLATSQPHKYAALQNCSLLLTTTIDLLKRLHTQSSSTTSEEDESLVGVKRRLVQLIANLVYQHRHNQDTVREKGGIPLVLQHTKIDEQNPYIVQFAILATRNLCQGNVENQRVISAMKLQGLTDNVDWLAEFGIKAELCGDKLIVKNPD